MADGGQRTADGGWGMADGGRWSAGGNTKNTNSVSELLFFGRTSDGLIPARDCYRLSEKDFDSACHCEAAL
ncbi:MAG: hypothetical protein KJ638_14930, partial [Chloroflexi bacterium]|nr:hypothetical protein [Chloroflexota bacterium]